MSENNEVLIDERGLTRYLDMQAGLGYTKHIERSKATRELLELCEVNPEKVVLNVGSRAVGMNEPIYVKPRHRLLQHYRLIMPVTRFCPQRCGRFC